VWTYDIKDCIHQNHIFRVRANNVKEIEPLFLSALIGSSYGKKYFLRAAKQTTGIATINSTQLKNFPVAVPPISLQRKYIKAHVLIGQIRNRMNLSLKEMNSQFNALTQIYFS
jgi:type I restriction enzyme S subunit